LHQWIFRAKNTIKLGLKNNFPKIYGLIIYFYSLSVAWANKFRGPVSSYNSASKIFSMSSGRVTDDRTEPILPLDFLNKLGATLDGYKELPRAEFSYAFMSENINRSSLNSKSNLVVMLVISALRVDPRVEREARALASNGYRVCVIAPDISHPPLRQKPLDWGDGITFDILEVSAANFSTSPPYLAGERFLAAALQYSPLAFHCHDLTTCLVGLAAGGYTGSKVVCDFHEWFSENVSWSIESDCYIPHPLEQKQIYTAAESLVMKKADTVITVNQSIASELENYYSDSNRKVVVVRNIPDLKLMPTRNYPPLKTQIGVENDAFLVLYQGGTGPTRALEAIIEALKFSPETLLLIRGPSLDIFGDGYREIAVSFGVSERLYMLPAVPSRDVVEAAKGADVGIWSLPNLCKNFQLALPNKIFEYVGAELPILAANYPEPELLLKEKNIGLVFDPNSPISIANTFEKMKEVKNRNMYKKNVVKFKKELEENNEMDKLIKIYDELST
jgi:glycosyltransferase involved in cell wall biosynthesis